MKKRTCQLCRKEGYKNAQSLVRHLTDLHHLDSETARKISKLQNLIRAKATGCSKEDVLADLDDGAEYFTSGGEGINIPLSSNGVPFNYVEDGKILPFSEEEKQPEIQEDPPPESIPPSPMVEDPPPEDPDAEQETQESTHTPSSKEEEEHPNLEEEEQSGQLPSSSTTPTKEPEEQTTSLFSEPERMLKDLSSKLLNRNKEEDQEADPQPHGREVDPEKSKDYYSRRAAELGYLHSYLGNGLMARFKKIKARNHHDYVALKQIKEFVDTTDKYITALKRCKDVE